MHSRVSRHWSSCTALNIALGMQCSCVEGSRSDATSTFDPGAADIVQDQERTPIILVLPAENEDAWRAKYNLEDMDVKSTIGKTPNDQNIYA